MVRNHRHEESQPLMMNDRDDSPERDGNRGADMAPSSTNDPGAGHPDAPLDEHQSTSNKNQPAVTTISHAEGSDSSRSAGLERTSSPMEVVSSEGDSGTSTPRFIQDERSWKRCNWVPYPLRRTWKAISKWSHGPPNPQPHKIKPLFPIVQEYPLFLVERFLPKLKWRFWLLFLYFSIWIITFVLVKREGSVATEIDGWGTPQDIGCGTTYWGSDNACGVDGNGCRPFNGSGFPFRCSGNCESYHILNPRAVGDQEVNYRSFVVGGASGDEDAIYRGDSFICAAAIHAGYVSNANGGCGVVELVGERDHFPSNDRNGINSIEFDSYFPLSFRFVPDIECEATDNRWSLLALSAVFTGVLSIFTASPALFFFPNFIMIFWTVGTALDTPAHRSTASLFANILGKFLPGMFCAWVMYDKMGIRRTLKGLTAQIEKTILWLGPCWVGAMDNYTLSFIPIQRLNAHDLQQQPGAKAALAIIVIVLLVVFVAQIWFFRNEGRLLKMLRLYALLIAAIVISLLLPGLNLRLHHYILALLLLPATSMQTRPSLLYQGLLIGLFINGIARWGFDPVLQTPDSLRGDAQIGSELPTIPTPPIELSNSTSNITFSWEQPSTPSFDGISILVNDVERFRSYFEDTVGSEDQFVWTRDGDLDMNEYFRFAFMDGSDSGDYTKAGVWTAGGEWREMRPGPSRVKARSIHDDRISGKGKRR